MRIISENLRYLLWSRKLQRSQWLDILADWVGSDQSRALALLQGIEPQPGEQEHIAQALDLPIEALVDTRLIDADEVNIVQANLRCLLDTLPHGRKKVIAAHLSVHPTTISRWCSGEQSPSQEHLAGLCRYFGLPYGTD